VQGVLILSEKKDTYIRCLSPQKVCLKRFSSGTMPEGGFLVKFDGKEAFRCYKVFLNMALSLISVTMKIPRSCQEKASAGLRLFWNNLFCRSFLTGLCVAIY
jgi:hypothetical protein